MSKLTVTFKDIPLQSIELGKREVGIGRDPSNALHIDSLALADHHAVVKYTVEGYVIRQLRQDYPVFLNGRPISEERLSDGDHIAIGKHNIYFIHEPPAPSFDDDIDGPRAQYRSFEGSFQVMNGRQIGMVIPLKLPVTQIGKGPSGSVVVTKGEEGYTVSAPSGEVLLTINGLPVPVGEEALLKHNDIVRINSSLLQFFQK
jgi:hypothetical protein